LPLPGCLVEMFPEDVDSPPEDSALHGGRVRTFKHERGNWATYVYLPYHPEDEFAELLDELLSVAKARGVVLNPQEEFHLSLSQTVVLRHHWIQPFTQSLKAGLVHCRRFVCTAGRLKVYCNAERTRYNPTHRPDTGLTRVLSELPQHHFFVFSVCLSSLQDVSGDGSVYWACSVAAPGPSSRQNYDGVSPGHFL
ncbi:U6 snRNA phosphodiesterase, partial [Larimichthys crocea]